ncbi:MAG: phosphohistidine phosphatase SixA [Nitrosotalea sp.]
MDLFILRHGDAGRRSATFRDDSKRPLTVDGKEEVGEIAKGLLALGIELDYIFTSPLLRSKQTAEIIFNNIKCKNPMSELDELKPEGNKLQLYKKLSTLKQDSSILIVGHEPYLSELVGEAISGGSSRIDLKKAGLVRIRTISFLPKIQGELRWLLTPKHLKRIAK